MGIEYTLEVGKWTRVPVKTEKLSFGRRREVAIQALYCGMPNSEVFSVAKGVYQIHGGFSVNIYYPKDTKEITLSGIREERLGSVDTTGHRFAVKSVTPEALILEYIGK